MKYEVGQKLIYVEEPRYRDFGVSEIITITACNINDYNLDNGDCVWNKIFIENKKYFIPANITDWKNEFDS